MCIRDSLSGHRYSLLSHAAFFIDPLFSSGLVLTTAGVDMLAQQLIHAFKENDFCLLYTSHISHQREFKPKPLMAARRGRPELEGQGLAVVEMWNGEAFRSIAGFGEL